MEWPSGTMPIYYSCEAAQRHQGGGGSYLFCQAGPGAPRVMMLRGVMTNAAPNICCLFYFFVFVAVQTANNWTSRNPATKRFSRRSERTPL